MKWTWNCITRRLMVGSIAAGVMMLGACTAPSSRLGGFESNNPATLLYAIQEAGEKKDRTKIPRLVESLENDDPAVRMMAIAALERITGSRLGYQPYASSVVRAPAVAQWQAVVRGGAILPLEAPTMVNQDAEQTQAQADTDTNSATNKNTVKNAKTSTDTNKDASAVTQ